MRHPLLRIAATTAALLAALTTAAACARPGSPLGSAQGPGTGTDTTVPTAVPTTATPTVTTKPTATKPAPAAPIAGADCTAGSLSYVGMMTEGAMGSLFTTFTVRNRSSVSCRLHGAPTVRYRRADGSTATLPATYDTGGSVLVPAGGKAGFPVREAYGYGGYNPTGPDCAHPASYHHLSIVLAGGSTLALGSNGSLSIQCGKFEVRLWGRS